MKNNQSFGVIKYTVAGIAMGFVMVIIGALFTYAHGFNGPWWYIFEYAPKFIILAFSPIFFGILFCFIGFRKAQLISKNHQLAENLSGGQEVNDGADNQMKLLVNIIQQINEAIVISDADGGVQWINESFTKINGYTLQEIKGRELGDFLYGPLTDKVVAKGMVESLAKGEAVEEDLVTYHKNGRSLWLSLSIKPIFDSAGNLSNFIAIQKNITSRKEKEISIEALYKTVADYKFALDQSAIVVIFNTRGKIVQVNKKFCEISGLSEAALLEHDYRSISVCLQDKKVVKPILKTLQTGDTWKGELKNCNKNGHTYWADTTIVPFLNADGKAYQFLAIQHDITERKELENQLISNKFHSLEAMQMAKLGSWEINNKGVVTISAELRRLYNLP
ncbi:MAG: PAS domain-containing protein, partial [Ferruginibacter sp.]